MSPNNSADFFARYFWLIHFTNNRYIAIIYDRTGKIQHCFNEYDHTHGIFISKLKKHSLFETYSLSGIKDLNEIFENSQYEFLRKGLDKFSNSELADVAESIANISPFYLSTNLADTGNLSQHVITDLPLSNIRIMKLNENDFLGIIRFELIQQPEDGRGATVITDDKGKVIVLNQDFAAYLPAKDPRIYLGASITDLAKFNSSPFPFKSSPVNSILPEISYSWRVGADSIFPFISVNSANKIIQADDRSIVCQAGNNGRTFYRFNEKLDFDSSDFDLAIDFQVVTGQYPSLVLRGKYDAQNDEDIDSWSLSISCDVAGKMLFRTRDQRIAFLDVQPPVAGKIYSLSVSKRKWTYSFMLNGVSIGKAYYSGLIPSDNNQGLFFFLRPNTTLRLISFSLNTVKNADTKPDNPVIASISNKGNKHHYNVVVEQRTMRLRNTFRFRFDDMTNLYNDLHRLKLEKERLAGFVRGSGNILGVSPSILAIRDQLTRLSSSGLTVLIEGETGSGKEVLAKALHDESSRSGNPFVKIDCASIPQSLMESELFGFEKGAFTGAHERHLGRFEQAEGGTVFLDEIGNLTMQVQAKLLGVLQDLKVQRIGGLKAISVNVRIICATNEPLQTLMAEGRFRADLYYRLNQIRLALPPLRERLEDIPILANHFIEEASLAQNKPTMSIDSAGLKKLSRYSWPGNVRELRNVIYRAVMLTDGEVISENELETEDSVQNSRTQGKKGTRNKPRIRKDDFIKAVSESSGNVTHISKSLGISRIAVYQRLASLGLKLDDYRP
ncbi:MAG: sigma-54-dependent Fis family transcriptional regulator [Fibrobacteres bacterium]|nr:sigma-54-dependent Fis family transcriptional regulator [Fibrobacterota bacterium]